jgi:hypothetical protein
MWVLLFLMPIKNQVEKLGWGGGGVRMIRNEF